MMRASNHVYIIAPIGMLGPFKIGFSAVPAQRLLELSVWSPFPLEIIATFPGARTLEKRIHECLAFSHSHHEWFLPTPDVLAFVTKIRSGFPVEEALDLTKPQRVISRKGTWSAESRAQARASQLERWARARGTA